MLLKSAKVAGEVNLQYFVDVFDTAGEIQFSPLNTIYYSIIYWINGYDPYYYHLGSLVLHYANCFLVYVAARELLLYFSIRRARYCAYVVALLWSIHPLNVEAVVWISASKVLLFSLFTLLSFISFLSGIKKSAIAQFLWSVFWYLCACLCKEQAMVIPFVHAALILCRKTNWKSSKLMSRSVYFFGPAMIVLAWIAWTNMVLNANNHFPTPIEKYSLWKTVILSFYCLRFYLTSVLFPVNLHFHYKYPFLPTENIGWLFVLFPVFFLLGVVIMSVAIKKSRNSSFYIFCILAFFIHIGLVLQIVPLARRTIMADRYMYIPLVFLLLPLCAIVVNLIWKQHRSIRLLSLILIGLFIIAFCGYSHKLVLNWKTNNLGVYGKK